MRSARSLAISAIVVILILAASAYLASGSGKERTAEISVNGTQYNVYIAATPEQQAQGLMNVTEVGTCSGYGNCLGMLFVFGSDSNQCFWMKDTQIPLDQYWIENGTITSEAQGTPYSLTPICHNGNWVLETPANTSIRVGQKAALIKYLT
ncbi:MAG: DUF192 domain-containing protein [Candidatus Micrarchaeota archaeon]|nr:DUF192 domain-containing protein [Candidatus Micrarchaeota archaeon]